MMSAQEAAQKWADNASRAGEAYKQGIQRTSVNPMEEAAKNVAGYKQGVIDAADSGRWQRGLRRRTKEEWIDAAVKLGASRYTQGVTNAKQRMASFLDQFMPYLSAGQARVKAMPNTTLQDRIARAVAMMEYTAKFQRT